jgi:MFS family permease
MMLVYAFTSTFQDQLYVYWLPSFLVDGRGLDKETMGLLTPLPLLGGALGSVLGGWLNDALIRSGWNRRWVRSGIGLAGKFFAGILVVVSVFVPYGWLAMVVLLGARIFGDLSLPTQWGAITDMAGRASGTVFGLVNAIGAVGGFVAGPVLGYLKQHHGWEGLFLGAAAMCIVAAAATWLFIDCTPDSLRIDGSTSIVWSKHEDHTTPRRPCPHPAKAAHRAYQSRLPGRHRQGASSCAGDGQRPGRLGRDARRLDRKVLRGHTRGPPPLAGGGPRPVRPRGVHAENTSATTWPARRDGVWD